MDTECLTVAYYDEFNMWPQISGYIMSQFPLQDIACPIIPLTQESDSAAETHP